MTKYISPSRIARFYFHECERYLRYSSTPRSDRVSEGIPATPYDASPVTHAILDGGYAWEEQVLAKHLAGRVVPFEAWGVRMADYHINVFWSDEDGCYVADIPDLVFCSAFGDTPEKALHQVLVAKEAWLESARDRGDPIPEPRYRPTHAG